MTDMMTRFYVFSITAVALTVAFGLTPASWAVGSDPGSNAQHPAVVAEAEDAPPRALTAKDRYNRGVYLFQVGQQQAQTGNHKGQQDLVKKAIVEFDAALALDATLVEAQSNIGFAYLTMGKAKHAIKAFNKALALNKNHLNSLNGLATAQAHRKLYVDSLQTFDKLTTLDPGNAEYWFNKGSIHQKNQQTDAAEYAYQQALKINPGHQQTWFNLGTLYENLHEFDDAQDAYTHVKSIDITTPIGLEATNRLQWLEAELKGATEPTSMESVETTAASAG